MIAGDSGPGQLQLDIDYILEWLCQGEEGAQFLIAPAILTFHEVNDLKIALDYATPTAALVPFSIDHIERRIEQRSRYDAILWKVAINWPVGEITFEANGFTQTLRAEPILKDQQSLSEKERE